MNAYDSQLNIFSEWIDYLEGIRDIPEGEQSRPLGEGKWAVRDVIAHMLGWDEYFWDHAVSPIVRGANLTYRNLDFNAFNAEAMKVGRGLAWNELLDATIRTRRKIVEAIAVFPRARFEERHVDADGNPFSIAIYLEDFVQHDGHHREQIERVLQGV